MSKLIVYKATNKTNGKCYIGKTSGTLVKRRQGHYDYASPNKLGKFSAIFHKAIASHGKDSFVWEILCEAEDHDNLNELEAYYIKLHNSKHPGGYNMTDGGDGMHGYKLTEDAKAKISVTVSALHQDPEYRARNYPKLKGLVPPNKCKAMSEEQKLKVSVSRKAVYDSPNYVNPNLGQKRTEKQKERIKKGQEGKLPTGEDWHTAHKGQYTAEVREKMRQKKLGKKPANTKKVMCLETGAVYDGLTDAATAMGINRQSIFLQIKGKLRKAGGYTFKYV